MNTFIDQQRFALVVGDTADEVAELSAVTVLDRVDRVLLVEVGYRTAVDIRDTAGVIVHVFERESDARRAFGLFRP